MIGEFAPSRDLAVRIAALLVVVAIVAVVGLVATLGAGPDRSDSEDSRLDHGQGGH